ncbi:ricin-type beta-trefoil lectin domain-containing protein [Ditylenchus destructor]|uniref:Polypeptide N-acetylgalactosaminyltransferase n=1 Tax=Ditylenchus destructor TaxID=166010 RepID=A0AAD4RCV1_9BILA|nr:ricin-type beta-trefoil lectin domain-containing protein [Ditylenchus destructor]
MQKHKIAGNVPRLGRYIPRKIIYFLLYILLIIGLLAFYISISSPQLPISDPAVSLHFREDGADPFVQYRSLSKKDWHDTAAYEADQKRTGAGEQGKPVIVSKDNATINKIRDDLYHQNGYDAYVSDQIALNRSVKDIRHKGCKDIKYIEKLPSVSVIFPFHDEHFSTLLRSAYSIINRSPPGIVVRTEKREGLIRARVVGAKAATAEIIVFLDAHSEANYNWLPPLIEPIALNYRTVVCPFVDVIDCDTYEYRPQDEGARGSFDWEFNYKRLPLTEEDQRNPTRPFKSPVMAGGYFAISTKWFWELGGYDEGLDIWGGEQYELSFKVWQCHGQMVDAPCSRVGHIYRCKYVPFPNPGVGDFISRNYKRVAEVWMDDYKEHLYKRRTAMARANPGDLSKQLAVRERLKCKSFDWFMKEIAFDQDRFYPAVEPPDGGNGELKNVAAKKCVDTQHKVSGDRFKLETCNSEDATHGGEQNLRMSFWSDIRPKGRTMCFDVSTSDLKAPVTLFACHGMKGNQFFKYRLRTRQIYHKVSNQCMDCDPDTGEIFMTPCDESKDTQKWEWSHLDSKVIEEWEQKEMKKDGL